MKSQGESLIYGATVTLPQLSFRLPESPNAWLTLCTSCELGHRPVSKKLVGRELVVFRTERGRVAVMHARCAHMGADLVGGRVVGESIQCPFHHWQFGVDGSCMRIPAEPETTPTACQTAFSAVEQHGLVFMFNGSEPKFELPFFPNQLPYQLHRAKPFQFILECPWYMVGANGVDIQHFRATHDRELLETPMVDYHEPFTHRTKMKFAVVGRGLADGLTRSFAGPEVTMEVTDWLGTLFFVKATFRRTQTFGMVGLLPLKPSRTLVTVTTFVRRSDSRIGRHMFDPANAAIRRFFVRNFLRPDIARSEGTDYHPDRLIAADALMADYFVWLGRVHGCPTQDTSLPAASEFV